MCVLWAGTALEAEHVPSNQRFAPGYPRPWRMLIPWECQTRCCGVTSQSLCLRWGCPCPAELSALEIGNMCKGRATDGPVLWEKGTRSTAGGGSSLMKIFFS